MDENLIGELKCKLILEISNKKQIIEKKSNFNNATINLGRNQFNDIIIKVNPGTKLGRDLDYELKDIKIFHKFASEGKCTLKIGLSTLLLSNCPPLKLKHFLNTLSAKMHLAKLFVLENPDKVISSRNRLLSMMPSSFTDISPISNKDISTIRKHRSLRPKPLAENKNALNIPTTPNRKTALKRKTFNDKENIPPKMSKIDQSQDLSPFTRSLMMSSAPDSVLSVEQRIVLRTVLLGSNVFFTGSAGTGKSFLLRKIIESLSPQYTFATASTGVAACQIGGSTLHSFAGIGTGSSDIEQCVSMAMRPGVRKNWLQCRHLIVDEISMIDGDFLDKMEVVARSVRRSDKPFGGIQLIFCGDFYQLPPIVKGNEKRKYAFQSKAWWNCINKNLQLSEVKRQNDPIFIDILQNIRLGICTKDMEKVLNDTVNNRMDKNGIVPTRLCTHNEDVNQINEIYLNKLNDAVTRVYLAIDSHPEQWKRMKQLSQVSDKITLRIGAQIMVTKNLDIKRGIVNGARGVILAFEKGSTGYPKVLLMNGNEVTLTPEKVCFKLSSSGNQSSSQSVMSRVQLPLKLAWAISIHKCQGMSLDHVEISLSRVFESGQAYVALSRATSLKGLRVTDFDAKCIHADKNVKNFYQNIKPVKQCIEF